MKVLLMIILGLATVSVTDAIPSIQWSGVQNISIGYASETGSGIANIDFDNNGALDYIFEYGGDSMLWVYPQNGNEMIMFDEAVHLPITALICEHFDAGISINENTEAPLLWASENDYLVQSLGGYSGGIAGYWRGVEHKYMGIRFNAVDGIHYGWIEMSVSDTYELATIHSWAYNTIPGEGLVTGVVPEPSTIMLFITGLAVLLKKQIKNEQ